MYFIFLLFHLRLNKWQDVERFLFSNFFQSPEYVASLVSQKVKNPPAVRENWVRSLGREAPLEAAAAAKSLQSCPTLCDPIDGSTPGSTVPGILQARTPEWVAISFSNA